MTEYLDVNALGLRIRVDLTTFDQDQRERAVIAWSGASYKGAEEAHVTVPVSGAKTFDAAMESLSVDVTLVALGLVRDQALMFHAAGVADAQGKVVAFVGPSGRGKTTLSRSLGAHYGYVSDETIAVEADLTVRPYRKPLSLVRERLPKEQVSPADAGLKALPDAPLSLSSLVLLERDAAFSRPEILSVPLVDAIPQLVLQMSYLKEQKAPLHAIARLCDAIGGVRILRYPDADTVPALVPDLLAHRSQPSVWTSAPVASGDGPYDVGGAVDAIITDGRVIVMVESTVHVLDGIAPTVWLAAAQGQSLEGIVAAVVAEYGEPAEGNAQAFVTAAIDELIAAGIVRQS